MSYRMGGGCCSRRSAAGLGAVVTDEQFIATRDMVLRGLSATAARIAGLAETAAIQQVKARLDLAGQWFQSALERFYGGNTPSAMDALGAAQRYSNEANGLINALRPQDKLAAQAQAQAQQGASFSYQVGQTVGDYTGSVERAITEPIASVVESVSPAAAAAVRSSGWILPAAVGFGLFLLLRR